MLGTDGLSSVFSIVLTFVLMLAVFACTYYVSKLLGKKYTSSASLGGGMEILDRVVLGKEQYLLIVKVGGKVLLLGCTANSITNLGEVDEATVVDGMKNAKAPADFMSFLTTAIKRSPQDTGEGEL